MIILNKNEENFIKTKLMYNMHAHCTTFETHYSMRRFSLSVCRSLHSHVIQLLRDQLGKRGLQPSDVILRTNLKFLTSAAGLPDVRLFVAEKFEQWVQNSKVCAPFKEY